MFKQSSEKTESQITVDFLDENRMANVDFNAVAESFTGFYYQTFSTNRSALTALCEGA